MEKIQNNTEKCFKQKLFDVKGNIYIIFLKWANKDHMNNFLNFNFLNMDYIIFIALIDIALFLIKKTLNYLYLKIFNLENILI